MSNQQDSSPKGLVTIIVALIGVLGTVAVAYFAFRGNIEPKQLEIHATQTAESIRATQIAAAPIQAGLTSSPTDNPVPTPTLYIPPPTSSPTAYIAPPPTAAPIVITNNVHIEKCCGIAGTQRSDPIDFTISVRTVDFLQIEYSQTKGCSDAFFHILLDNVPVYTTEHFGPISGNYTTGLIDLSPYISQGRHVLTLSPEGVVGGCNSGTLGSWGGDLIIHTNEYP
jgi:hypothetical protein